MLSMEGEKVKERNHVIGSDIMIIIVTCRSKTEEKVLSSMHATFARLPENTEHRRSTRCALSFGLGTGARSTAHAPRG